jgi:hypothetical protein
MESFRKQYCRHILLLALGAVPLALIWNVENRWIAMPVGIVSILFILLQLSALNNVADAHTKYIRNREEEKERAEGLLPEPASPQKQKIVYYSFLVLFYLTVLPITVTGKKVENYLEWQPLVVDILKLVWIPFGFAWLYHKAWKVRFDKRDRQDHVTIASFVIPLMLLFHGIVWYNHLKPSALIARETVSAQDKSKNPRYGTKYLFVDIRGERKRFELPNVVYAKIQEQDSLRIHIRQGALGYAYIDSFIVLKN